MMTAKQRHGVDVEEAAVVDEVDQGPSVQGLRSV